MQLPIYYWGNLANALLKWNVSYLRRTAMNRLKLFNNNSLRRLLSIHNYCSAYEMCLYLNIRSFDEMLRKYVLRFVYIHPRSPCFLELMRLFNRESLNRKAVKFKRFLWRCSSRCVLPDLFDMRCRECDVSDNILLWNQFHIKK